MTIEVRPLGVRCNLSCKYCYQDTQRRAGNVPCSYDLDAIEQALMREGAAFTLFGGEPLLLPVCDLRRLWTVGLRCWGRNSIQTNGTLITESHICMFKHFNVHVGISIDGPGNLNRLRFRCSDRVTNAYTARTEEAIRRLSNAGIPPSLIVTLHRHNATRDRLPVMHRWVRQMDKLGIGSIRLHILESHDERTERDYALGWRGCVEALLSFAQLERSLTSLRFDLFKNIRDMLLGNDRDVTCIFRGCDAYNTQAVRGIEGDGTLSNCGRVNTDGVEFTKADVTGFERYLSLRHVSWEEGGCRGCRFFLFCKGQCPGTAIDGDWRNRSRHCGIWTALYRHFEKELLNEGRCPISCNLPVRRRLEMEFVMSWNSGRNVLMSDLLTTLTSAHSEIENGAERVERWEPESHGDAPPHTDEAPHDDHDDSAPHDDHDDSAPHNDHDDSAPHEDYSHDDSPHFDHQDGQPHEDGDPRHADVSHVDMHGDRQDHRDQQWHPDAHAIGTDGDLISDHTYPLLRRLGYVPGALLLVAGAIVLHAGIAARDPHVRLPCLLLAALVGVAAVIMLARSRS